jgi:sugar phosphate isomerase/epimerase
VRFDAILKAVKETGFSGTSILEIISPSPLEDLGASAAILKRSAID